MVTVVIPTFNRAALLPRAVDSVLAQTYQAFELIVVDDHSGDETPEALAQWQGDGRVSVIRHAENRGVSAARNTGLAAGRGELAAFLDSDDEWLPSKLEAQAEYFAAHPEAMLVQTQERWMRKGRRVNPGQKHLKKAGDIFIDSVSLCLISPSAVMLRRRLLDEVGNFDETLRAAEDYDLWLRVLARYPAGLIDRELVIRHGGRDDQLSAQPGLDKYRVMALEKILREPLTPARRQAAEAELQRRRGIYEAGRLKRAGVVTE
ncbi:MAG: glycosyltransferase family 2 protein [Candidatus Adiutrix sp.]|jgi:glycosyltransferase involved in cell wall biosynthesis|nr:glycosyltransferase family 2 protein [Candidatus Adiutrix sp.]